MSLLRGQTILVYGVENGSDAGGHSSLRPAVVELVELVGAQPLSLSDPRALSRLGPAEVLGAIDLSGDVTPAGYPIVTATTPRNQRPTPLAVPESVGVRLHAAELLAKLLAADRGALLELDAVGLLSERMQHTDFGAPGPTSVGGSATMVEAADGWCAVNLARSEDIAALSALLEVRVDPANWAEVSAAFAQRTVQQIDDQAALLGMPVATVGGLGRPDPQAMARGQAPVRSPWLIDGQVPVRPRLAPQAARSPSVEAPLVVELASLWAGPLCARTLLRAGCRVIKAESTARPDGARHGPASFFAALNDGKESFGFDHRDPDGIAALARILADADVVIDGSRPRVMEQWGIDRDAFVAGGGHWVSITGYGATGPWANRVAFGDDAAASAGLVTVDGERGGPPHFVGDAIADPIGGLFGALVALASLAGHSPGTPGHRLDISLREAAGFVARPLSP